MALLFVTSLPAADEKLHPKKKREKPAVEGTFHYSSKTYKLQHGLAYRNKDGDQVTTKIYLAEKPFPAAALKSLEQVMQTNGNDEEFFIFDLFFFVAVQVEDEMEPNINVMLPDGGGFNVTEDESKAKVREDRV